ncbi:MAG: 3-phosphoshikimate 1-carboxyvinyltransferase, partial [Roseivirga sp.]
MDKIHLKHSPIIKEVEIPLPASKSESNRALILNALSGNLSQIQNIS